MSVRPYGLRKDGSRGRGRRSGVGLVLPGGRVVDEAGTVSALPDTPTKGLKLYADRYTANDALVKGIGTAVLWNNATIRWEVGEWTGRRAVYVLNPSLGADLPEFMGGLVAWRDWAEGYGAGIGSVGQTSYYLLRASLTRSLFSNQGDAPPLADVIGGRQEGRPPGRYGEFELWDMARAYSRTLGAMAYGGRWVRWPDNRLEDVWQIEGIPVFVRASVRLPILATTSAVSSLPDTSAPISSPSNGWGPLPRRRRTALPRDVTSPGRDREYPKAGRMRGVWAIEEVRAALAVGARVKVHAAWVCPGEDMPFAGWWGIIEEGRERFGADPGAALLDVERRDQPDRAGVESPNLPGPGEQSRATLANRRPVSGPAERLVKATANALWGQGLTGGVKTRAAWRGGRKVLIGEPEGGKPPSHGWPDVSETVAARVRARLYAELMVPNAGRLIGVHTDGGLIACEAISQSPIQTSPLSSSRNAAGTSPSLFTTPTVSPLATSPRPTPISPDAMGSGGEPNKSTWRLKTKGRHLIYLGPQTWSYQDEGGRVQYRVSGARRGEAPRLFATLAEAVLNAEHDTDSIPGVAGMAAKRRAHRAVLQAFPTLSPEEAWLEVRGWFPAPEVPPTDLAEFEREMARA